MVCRHEKAPFRSLNRFMPGRYFSAYLSATLLNWRWLAGICRNMQKYENFTGNIEKNKLIITMGARRVTNTPILLGKVASCNLSSNHDVL
jgi:hypothetical protein